MSLANVTGARSSVSLAVGDVAADTVETRTLAVPGAEVGDLAIVNTEAALTAGLGLGQAYVVGADEVEVEIVNPTGGILDADDVDFRVQLIKATGSL
jgi:hypothetical protein